LPKFRLFSAFMGDIRLRANSATESNASQAWNWTQASRGLSWTAVLKAYILYA